MKGSELRAASLENVVGVMAGSSRFTSGILVRSWSSGMANTRSESPSPRIKVIKFSHPKLVNKILDISKSRSMMIR
jgi:hypothetical protein